MNSKSKKSLQSLIEESSQLIERFIWINFPNLNRQDKEDISQEVKIKILKKLESGRKIKNFKSYLKRVVYTTALDTISKERIESFGEKEMELNLANHLSEFNILGPEVSFEKTRTNRILHDAINSLSANRRIVIKLYLKGLNVRETAEFLGWSTSRVNHLFYRGIEDLRKKVDRSAF
jgi:RNA polymerase sigma factor (sigma-70 family)